MRVIFCSRKVTRKCKYILLLPLLCSAYVFYSVVRVEQRLDSHTALDSLDDPVLQLRMERYLSYRKLEPSRTGPGEQGMSVSLEKDEKARAAELQDKEGFNIVASDKIALDRSLKDYRNPDCKARSLTYPGVLPKASVIVVYFNEAWSAVLRTVHSVVNRSPPQFLQEVILLDDSSTREELLEPLTRYVSETWPDGIVRIIRTPERSGLIRAKLFGAKQAVGDVLIFLDAHCEASPGWLEPMLVEIQEDSTRVICPIIDNIGAGSMGYGSHGGNAVGGFWWSMHFSWRGVPERERKRRTSDADTIRSPTMAGGLFAVGREFFFHIGGYDDGMEIWGGENLDLSFRIWMCGGSLLFAPCSHVGHIFRSTHPYGFPDKKRDYHGLNSKRVAEVWMDDYKRLFYLYRPDLKDKDCGDLTERHALRQGLQCHNFTWYLENVYPEKFILDVHVVAWGQVRNAQTNLCLDILSHDEKMDYALGVWSCHSPITGMNQVFTLSSAHELRREESCAEYTSYQMKEQPVMMRTRCGGDSQKWTYKQETGEFIHEKSGLCLDVANVANGKPPRLDKCAGTGTQHWTWSNLGDYKVLS